MDAQTAFQLLLVPPLAIYKWKSPPEKDGKEHDAAEDHKPDKPERHSALRPLLTLSLTCLSLSGFATNDELSDPRNAELVLLAYVAPAGYGNVVTLALIVFMVMMVAVTVRHRPKHLHGIDHLLIPEIVVFGFFFVANLLVGGFMVLDSDLNSSISRSEVERNWPRLIPYLMRRWVAGNMALLLSITITESIAPQATGLAAVIFDAGWAIGLAEAVSLFLNNTLCRSAALKAWTRAHRGSSLMALLYGFSLYYYTHGLALIAAVIFRKHEGVPHPPTVDRVCKVLLRQRLALPAVISVLSFILAVLAVVTLPCLLDHPPAAAKHTNGEPLWLHAVSQGMLSGPAGCFVLTTVNVAVILAALVCYSRPQVRTIRASYEAALTWAVAGLGSLSWCRVLMNASGPSWQYSSAVFAFFTHICIAAFSADVFAGRQDPTERESLIAAFWASVQLIQGLAAEHHAATCHHGDGPMDPSGLLNHLGEFGLCEFGLIVSLAWVTEIMTGIHDKYKKRPALKISGSSLPTDLKQPSRARVSSK